jgi:hypothetical protein
MTKTFGELSFSEKIFHKMAHDKRPILSELADKASVKALVSSLIGNQYIVPTIAVIKDESELDFTNYPREFVLKPTHGSQAGILVYEESERSEDQLLPANDPWAKYYDIHPDDLDRNKDFMRLMTERWLNSRYRPDTEYCYQSIPQKIIIEDYIKMKKMTVLSDFRFYVFHGEVKLFRAAAGYMNGIPTYGYDANGEYLHIKAVHDAVEVNALDLPPLPKHWMLMKEFAEKLSMGIDFIRVDFFLSGSKIYFSELTNYPLAGYIKFLPESYDHLLSSYWKKCDCCII